MSEAQDPKFYEDLLIKFLYLKKDIRERVLPFLSKDLFDRVENRKIIKHITSFIEKYDNFPKIKDSKLVFSEDEQVYEHYNKIMSIDESEYDDEFLLDELEAFIKEKMVSNVCIDTMGGLSEGELDDIKDSPDKLRDAFAFSFDTTVGLDFFNSADRLFDFFHKKEYVIPTGISNFDNLIGGGFHEKTLTLFLAECVSEDTKVTILFDNNCVCIVKIKLIKMLLNKKFNLKVHSPDGWVKVKKYINKGKKELYEVNVNGKSIKCSKNHIFETNKGWCLLKKLITNKHKILCDDKKYHSFTIKKLNKKGNVVDISVDHKNHRYYTNGISSHNSNLGKSLIMNSLAVGNIMQNKKVLYITCEMSEEKVAERVIANLLDVSVSDIDKISRKKFTEKFTKFKEQFFNNFIIKEYPTKSISINNIRNLLKDLELKFKYVPDIIYLDQIENLYSAYRTKSDNTYSEMTKVTQEVRGFGVEKAIPIVSCIQTNRCLDLNTKVQILRDDEQLEINISDLQNTDLIYGNNGYKKVNEIYPIENNDCYEITLESGKKIICSKKHQFPTDNDIKSIETGLKIGDELVVLGYKKEKIVSIKKIGNKKTIDISVDGNNLFFANGILTHNSGYSSSELDLTDTGDSLGFVKHADIVVGVTQPEELRLIGKYIWIILKNRYGINKKKITTCVTYDKMRVTEDKDSVESFRNDFDKTPPTSKEKKATENNAIDNLSSIIRKNKEKDKKKVFDYD